MYIATLADSDINSCAIASEITLTKVTPTGTETHICIPIYINSGALISLNQELNSIISQGYKLIETNNGDISTDQNGLINATRLN